MERPSEALDRSLESTHVVYDGVPIEIDGKPGHFFLSMAYSNHASLDKLYWLAYSKACAVEAEQRGACSSARRPA